MCCERTHCGAVDYPTLSQCAAREHTVMLLITPHVTMCCKRTHCDAVDYPTCHNVLRENTLWCCWLPHTVTMCCWLPHTATMCCERTHCGAVDYPTLSQCAVDYPTLPQCAAREHTVVLLITTHCHNVLRENTLWCCWLPHTATMCCKRTHCGAVDYPTLSQCAARTHCGAVDYPTLSQCAVDYPTLPQCAAREHTVVLLITTHCHNVLRENTLWCCWLPHTVTMCCWLPHTATMCCERTHCGAVDYPTLPQCAAREHTVVLLITTHCHNVLRENTLWCCWLPHTATMCCERTHCGAVDYPTLPQCAAREHTVVLLMTPHCHNVLWENTLWCCWLPHTATMCCKRTHCGAVDYPTLSQYAAREHTVVLLITPHCHNVLLITPHCHNVLRENTLWCCWLPHTVTMCCERTHWCCWLPHTVTMCCWLPHTVTMCCEKTHCGAVDYHTLPQCAAREHTVVLLITPHCHNVLWENTLWCCWLITPHCHSVLRENTLWCCWLPHTASMCYERITACFSMLRQFLQHLFV